MIRPAGDPKFGDYQANCAMSLGKQLGKPPRDIATDLVAGVSLDSLCSNVEIAGTQFGMIIYGYKHFLDKDAFDGEPVKELGRLYKLVRQIMDYHATKKQLPVTKTELATAQEKVEQLKATPETDDKKANKKRKKELNNAISAVKKLTGKIEGAQASIKTVEASPELAALANQHAEIGNAALLETAALHEGDETNVGLWEQFLPMCRADIQKIYSRLNIVFDKERFGRQRLYS